MGDPIATESKSLPPPPPPAPAAQASSASSGGGGLLCLPRPEVRLTSEFDSDSGLFFQKVSCRLFDRLAKLKLSFQHDPSGAVAFPQLAFLTKHFSVLYDLHTANALLKGSLDLPGRLQLRATHDIKEQQGEVTIAANLVDPSFKFELSSSVPSVGLPRASLRFPFGEVSVEEKESESEDIRRVLSVNGIVKANFMNGVCTALYRDNDLNLRYCYKDEEMSLIPSISLPSNALSFGFKRRFGPLDKLSYWYHFDSNEWSTVYKHTVGKDLKFKAGYDSEVRLGWASLWVGDEDGKAKTAPMKMKVQFMLQVPQDNIGNSIFMFRVKKRWDL